MPNEQIHAIAVPSPAGFPPPQDGIECAVEIVARHANIQKSLLFHASRCPLPTARARQLAMYLSHVVLGRSLTAVGQAFGRDRTTVSYACALIEDMRDDSRFDAEVSALECRLQRATDLSHG